PRSTGPLMGTSLAIDELTLSQPTAPGMLNATGTYDLKSGEYAVMLTGDNWQVAATDDQPLSGTASLRFTGNGTLDDPRGEGQITVRGTTVRAAADDASAQPIALG